ncbi:hypothetical protein OSSY52_10680 [Tepiditoga spiralis]|uniref:Uncharacterized protein n=1 Tax=Tepiditoga spiralis TaxID=2108365 RepID=A0A7G1G7L4_9BACT|nr:hypothetical protein [Tepiditoga spiralis]BBE30927.1 hypothetical protein OSSY52_10680 [Tepiditoga spiralis]
MLKKLNMIYSTLFMISMLSGFNDISNIAFKKQSWIRVGSLSFLTIFLYFLIQLLFIIGIYIIENKLEKEEDTDTNILFFSAVMESIAIIFMMYFSKFNILYYIFINIIIIYFNNIILYKSLKINNLEINLKRVLKNCFFFSTFDYVEEILKKKI